MRKQLAPLSGGDRLSGLLVANYNLLKIKIVINNILYYWQKHLYKLLLN